MAQIIFAVLALGTTFGGILAYGGQTSEADFHAALFAMSMGRDIEVPPVGNGSEPVRVNLNLNLINLRDVDEARNEVEVITWLELEWTDKRLAWKDSDSHENYNMEGNPENVLIFPIDVSKLWTPDITLYNSVQTPEVITPKEAVVSGNGQVFYVPGIRFRFSCNLADVGSREGANCTMKFGSWANNGYIIDVGLRYDVGVRLDEYMVNPSYDVIDTSAARNVQYYACCEEPYPDVRFSINIRKKQRSWFWRG